MLLKELKKSLFKISSFTNVVIAVSGGMDSIALAYALKKLDYNIIIAHLNHQLRNESNADAEFVKKLAKKWKVPFVISKKKISKIGNLENNARKIRYEFLENVRKKHKADFIAVAHHFDDQIETILMHMTRGAGLRGQIGMQFINNRIIRPFLHIPQKDIIDFINKNKLPYRIDRSNFNLSNDRNYWRHMVIPYLKKEINNFESKIKNISRQAEKKLTILKSKAVNWILTEYQNNELKRKTFNQLSNDLKSEVLIQILGANNLYRKNIDQLIQFIKKGRTGKKLKVKNNEFVIGYNKVFIRNHSLSGSTDKIIKCQNKYNKHNLQKITIKGIKWNKWNIKITKVDKLFVRQWQKGDRFQPNGMKGSKKLQDFFVDQKIPQYKRHQIPIIVNQNNDIMAIGNLRFSAKAVHLKNKLKITL